MTILSKTSKTEIKVKVVKGWQSGTYIYIKSNL
jgi:hypothetical protein